jgi:hypothetical protein
MANDPNFARALGRLRVLTNPGVRLTVNRMLMCNEIQSATLIFAKLTHTCPQPHADDYRLTDND